MMPRLRKLSISKYLVFGIAVVTLLNSLAFFSCRFSDSACPFSSNQRDHEADPDLKQNKEKSVNEDGQPRATEEKSDQEIQIVDPETHKEMTKRVNLSMESAVFNFTSTDYVIAGEVKKRNAFLVIGVPTIKRKRASYLTQTLRELVEGLDEPEKDEVLIVVLVADFDPTSVISITEQISKDFSQELSSGLIRVVKAPNSFYPNLDKLPPLWEDKPERIRWRSKQCLDYAFLFRYSKDLGQFYLQIEDDMSTSKGYLQKIKKHLLTHENRKWSVLEFGARGFIGMMYRTSDLARLSTFVKMYYWVFPVDILFRQFNDFCLYGNPQWSKYKPPLFRHIGTFSSLDGQVRMLEDIKVEHRIYQDSDNPEADVTTSIRDHVGRSNISAAYDTVRHGMFWGKNVRKGDYILVEFLKPVRLSKLIVESGGADAPEDYFGAVKIFHAIQNVDTGECKEFLLWKKFEDMPQLKVLSRNPKGILCSCVKIEITGLRRDSNGNPRWLAIREIAVWTKSEPNQ